MEPFLQNPNSRESAQIIEQVRSACETSGFFQLTNHGVPFKLQESLFKAAESFFTLPYDEKKKLDCKQHLGHRGYDLLASQSYEPGVLPDLKEVSRPTSEMERISDAKIYRAFILALISQLQTRACSTAAFTWDPACGHPRTYFHTRR